MANEQKLTLEELIEKTDAAKKKNPLDLSSDQDLSIALMNLISLEEHFFFSGAKTEKPGYYDLIQVVREMRTELMKRIVDQAGHDGAEVWCISKHLLAACMRLKEVGDKANGAGKREEAHDLFNKAYELYSLFWGINMRLIDLTGVSKIDGALPHGLDIWVNDIKNVGAQHPGSPENQRFSGVGAAPNRGEAATKTGGLSSAPTKTDEPKSLTKRLGAWVRKAVDCCIE
ncbi:MAG: hypothetical protein FWC51_02035 [Proteobacteria bacterium]|nr:hypothetical protein [Pseudomonadota bacterium]